MRVLTFAEISLTVGMIEVRAFIPTKRIFIFAEATFWSTKRKFIFVELASTFTERASYFHSEYIK